MIELKSKSEIEKFLGSEDGRKLRIPDKMMNELIITILLMKDSWNWKHARIIIPAKGEKIGVRSSEAESVKTIGKWDLEIHAEFRDGFAVLRKREEE